MKVPSGAYHLADIRGRLNSLERLVDRLRLDLLSVERGEATYHLSDMLPDCVTATMMAAQMDEMQTVD